MSEGKSKGKGKVPGLDTAISRHLTAIKKRDALVAKEDANSVGAATRCLEIGMLLSKFLADNEGVGISAEAWMITESRLNDGLYVYEIRYIVAEEAEVWCRNVPLDVLEAGTFPLRWTARIGESYQKFDKFVAAAAYAKTGKR